MLDIRKVKEREMELFWLVDVNLKVALVHGTMVFVT